MYEHVKRILDLNCSLKLEDETRVFLIVFEEIIDFNVSRADLFSDNNDVFISYFLFFLYSDLSDSDAFNFILERVLFICHNFCKKNLSISNKRVQNLVTRVFPKECSIITHEEVRNTIVVVLEVELNWISFEGYVCDLGVSFCVDELVVLSHDETGC